VFARACELVEFSMFARVHLSLYLSFSFSLFKSAKLVCACVRAHARVVANMLAGVHLSLCLFLAPALSTPPFSLSPCLFLFFPALCVCVCVHVQCTINKAVCTLETYGSSLSISWSIADTFGRSSCSSS